MQPGDGDAYYRMNGAGATLVFSAADFEDFLEPRPELPTSLEAELKRVVTLLAEKRWPFRIHASYDESIGRILNIYEDVNRTVLFEGLHWFIDHAETISERNIERVKALSSGIAVQNRMAFQLERLRDGAIRSELFHDPANQARYVETFLVESWVEHLRLRVTLADREAKMRARSLHMGATPLTVSHR